MTQEEAEKLSKDLTISIAYVDVINKQLYEHLMEVNTLIAKLVYGINN